MNASLAYGCIQCRCHPSDSIQQASLLAQCRSQGSLEPLACNAWLTRKPPLKAIMRVMVQLRLCQSNMRTRKGQRRASLQCRITRHGKRARGAHTHTHSLGSRSDSEYSQRTVLKARQKWQLTMTNESSRLRSSGVVSGRDASSKQLLMRCRIRLAPSMSFRKWQYSFTPGTPNVLFTDPTCTCHPAIQGAKSLPQCCSPCHNGYSLASSSSSVGPWAVNQQADILACFLSAMYPTADHARER